MTFPLAGDLPDPWIDGENPNAATMKQRITDKLNLLAGALGTRTARVSAKYTRAALIAVPNGTLTQVPLTAIGSSTGGAFVLTGGGVQFPAAGVYAFRVRGNWSAAITARSFIEAYTPSDVLVRQPTGVGEDTMAFVGYVTIVTPATDIVKLQAIQFSGGSLNFTTVTLDVIKISE